MESAPNWEISANLQSYLQERYQDWQAKSLVRLIISDSADKRTVHNPFSGTQHTTHLKFKISCNWQIQLLKKLDRLHKKVTEGTSLRFILFHLMLMGKWYLNHVYKALFYELVWVITFLHPSSDHWYSRNRNAACGTRFCILCIFQTHAVVSFNSIHLNKWKQNNKNI